MKRTGFLALLLGALAVAPTARSSIAAVETPVITEPAADGQVVNPHDVHMVAGPFVGSPGETHVCSDWEIRGAGGELAWTAPCATGAGLVHVHLGDGTFVGPYAGRTQLNSGSDYRLRVRFLGDASPEGTDWSEWAERPFSTSSASGQSRPLVLSDVSVIPVPRWRDADGHDVVLPAAGTRAASLRLEILDGGVALALSGADGLSNHVTNADPLPVHGAVRVIIEAGETGFTLLESILSLTDGSGQDRDIYLPALTLDPGEIEALWIGEAGGAFLDATEGDPHATPVFADPLTEPPVPWAVRQPGFRVERFATGFQLPVNLAFVREPGSEPDAPFFYVTELYGKIKAVTRSGVVSDYATDLLNFNPIGSFPGTGEKGLTGIAVEPVTGDLFVGSVFEVAGQGDFHFPEVRRLHSEDGGRTAATHSPVIQFPGDPMGASHQTSNVSIGPDGMLYVHIGDGLLTTPAQDLESARGKILRLHLDGTAPSDNPFYDPQDGISTKDMVFALGLRNPFGGAWREADGSLWEVENGPGTDRLAKIVSGRNYLWDGSDASMSHFASYKWFPSHAPVNIAFAQPSTFGGSGFPEGKLGHAFVTESGATYAPGPQVIGKRISELVLDVDGDLLAGPVPLVDYVGAGRGTAVGLAAGPDGLYFTDLYKNLGAATPTAPGASVFRVFWTGIADFEADVSAGTASLAVQFRDASDVPGASAWHWEFGDGGTSDQRDPLHVYHSGGSFDVRLTVTGSGGEAYRQKAAFVVVASPERELDPATPARPLPRVRNPR
jgi:glucose/arabinose dehydrogenase